MENSFVLNKKHSEKLKSLWSTARSKYTLFLYSSTTFDLKEKFPNAIKLANIFKILVELELLVMIWLKWF